MALTIQKTPEPIAFSKNIVAYQVDTDTSLAVNCRVWVEDTPYSDTWTFLTEQQQPPNSSGQCFFYLEGLLEEDVLTYDKPDVINTSEDCPNCSRRIYCEFYEYDPDDLELLEEFYHILSDNESRSELPISTALETGEDYLIIMETEVADPPPPTIEIDGPPSSLETFDLLYVLGDEIWYDITDIDSDHDEINIPGYTKATLYKGTKPTLTPADPITVLLGGYFETDLENATFEHTPDGIIVSSSDGVGLKWLW